MSDIHITRAVLRAVHRGDLPLSVLLEIGWRHLLKLCPACETEYRAWLEERRSARPLQADPKVLEGRRREEKRARRKAAAEAADLIALPFTVRMEKIQRSHRRYRDCRLAQILLEESRERMAADPEAAEELADTARAVLMQAQASPDLPGLTALAALYRANVSRLRGRPDEALERFTRARTILQTQGVTDLLIYGETDVWEALLALDRRDLPRAQELLKRSVALYLLAGAREKAADPLMALGRVYDLCGDLAQAAEVTRAAAQFGDSQGPSR